MPEAISTFGEKVFQIAQEMDDTHATECVMFCPINELPSDHERQVPRELERRLILFHGNAWIKCSESRVHDGARALSMKSILNSEYFKREGIYPGKCANKVIRSHTCGLISEKNCGSRF